MPSSLSLIIDITNPNNSGIIQDFSNRLPAQVPTFVRNDVESVSLRFVRPSAGTTRPWDDVDYSTAATILALGEFDIPATSGSNTFRFGPQTTGDTHSNTTIDITGSTAGITNGMFVQGSGIISGTTITISGSTVTLSQAATSTITNNPLYFYNETAPVPTGSSAATVSTAVNALASLIAAGGSTVQLLESGAYLMILNTAGVTSGFFGGNPAGLNPASSLVVSEVVVGAVNISSQQLIEIFVNPYALNSTWTVFSSASGTFVTTSAGSTVTPTGNTSLNSAEITSVSSLSGVAVGMSITGAGIPSGTTILSASGAIIVMSQVATATASTVTLTITSPNIQVLTLTPGAYDGSIQITTPLITTTAIAVPLSGVTATAIQTSLNALGASYTVSGNAGGPFAISIAGSQAAYTANVSGMIVPLGLMGSLNLSTFAMLQKFIAAGLSTVSLELECQVTPLGGGQATPLQLVVTVNKDVINLSSLVPSPIFTFYTQAQVDAIIAAISGYGSETVSSTASTGPTISIYCKLFSYHIQVNAGSGSYLATILLPDVNRVAGDKCFITLTMAASTNPQVNIEDGGSGTPIWIENGTGLAYAKFLSFTFNGSVWISDQ